MRRVAIATKALGERRSLQLLGHGLLAEVLSVLGWLFVNLDAMPASSGTAQEFLTQARKAKACHHLIQSKQKTRII